MKKIKLEIPVVSSYIFEGMFDEGMTDEECLELVINDYNKSASRSMALKSMMTGTIVNFPLCYARILK